jgi:hypothetical protein
MNYYGMGGIPDIVWDGIIRQVGSGGGDVDGTNFAAIIDDRLTVDSPLSVSVLSYNFDGGTPSMTVKIEIFTDLSTNANTYLRAGVCENGLSYGGVPYHNVLRDMLPDTPLTIMNVGEIQEVTIPLALDPTWNRDELWAFAFVQRDSDREIYNAGSTFVTPYSMNVAVDGEQQAVIAAPYTFGTTTVTHVGIADENVVDLTLDTGNLPEGWDAYFTLDGQDLTSATVNLGQYQAADLDVTMIPGEGSGTGRAVLTVHSQSGTVDDVVLPFVGIVSGANILIVADDGGAGYAYDYFGPAIGMAGKTFSVWERELAAISSTVLSPYSVIIWQTGNKVAGLDQSDRDAVTDYINGGGRVFLSGEKVVSTTAAEAGAWCQFYLRASPKPAENSTPDVTGVASDPVSNGLVLSLLGGDGANNYNDPDVVEPVNGGGGVQCFSYDADSGAGAWAEYGDTRILTLGFGFESINDVADRNQLMYQALAWLVPSSGVGQGSGVPSVAVLRQNVPNPFNPQTKISFNLESKAPVQLAVYDLTGRLVNVLADEVREAGENTFIWDGRDMRGDHVSSGTYIYRLISGDQIESRKMTMLK